MAQYVDGFVLNVPKKKLDAYKKMAKRAGKIWMEHGAISYYECVGEDMKVKMGIPFPKLAGSKPTEIPVFSFIIYKSRKHRDAVNKKVMADPRIHEMCPDPKDMPFDCDKMTYGGFQSFVNL